MKKTKTELDAVHGQILFEPGSEINLDKIDPDTDVGMGTEEEAQESLKRSTEQMVICQDKLMAHETYGLLVLFQGMDASGKDEAVTHVLSSLDPRGCEFKQFRTMTSKEEKHDYLWRVAAALPARGQIGIFNRSYYEHVVAERVHPETLESQGLPAEAKKGIWEKRFRHINHFEQYLAENGIHLLKFFLHVSKEEQRKRLLLRIDRPELQWQFSQRDVEEREYWKKYEKAYSDALTQTNTQEARWHVIPADRDWCARAAVASVIAAKLDSLHSGYPKLSDEEQKALKSARRRLEKDNA
ncbi:MAG: PPK2 family polyphosphate kinase [Armatimonadota bacterium]